MRPRNSFARKASGINSLTLSGTASLLAGETLSVTVNGATYDNVSVSGGAWSINTATATPSSGTLGAFVNGSSYGVTTTVTDAAGNSSSDSTANELTIDTTPLTATITGNSAGTVTITFGRAVDTSSFTEGDITVVNGSLVAGSLVNSGDDKTFTFTVTSDLDDAGYFFADTNVAVALSAMSVIDQTLGNTNVLEVKNTTNILGLFGMGMAIPAAPGFDLENWDVSHVTDARGAFSNNSTFNRDISNWNTGNITTMAGMFQFSNAFTYDIGGWDTSNVTDMSFMLEEALSFNHDIGSWDVGNVTSANTMFFNNFGMSVVNMDSAIRGWADVNTAVNSNGDLDGGQSALQTGVNWGVYNYSDATAVEYLTLGTPGWTLNLGAQSAAAGTSNLVSGTANIDLLNGDNNANTLVSLAGADEIYGLAGDDVIHAGTANDTVDGGLGNDTIHGGSGDDLLTGGAGADTFVYGFVNAGNDVITDFDATVDVLDISTLLDIDNALISVGAGVTNATIAATLDGSFVTITQGDFSAVSTALASATNSAATDDLKIEIDANGDGSGADVTIILEDVTLAGIHSSGTSAGAIEQLLDSANLAVM